MSKENNSLQLQVKNLKKIVSALPLLNPISVFDTKTGEQVPLTVLQDKINLLIEYCYQETLHLYGEQEENIHVALTDRKGGLAPAEFARQNGYKTRKNLPKQVKAQSRVEKLIQYKLIAETNSYIQNPNPKKNPFSFNKTINLGAVDKQMASLSLKENELTLLWKCWDEEYLLEFNIPSYILKRNILKFSLPTVSSKGFVFTITEQVPERGKGNLKAGLDLGRKTPYTIAVTNQHGNRVAHYTTSKKLTHVNNKRERLLKQNKELQTKIQAYTQLGLPTQTLKNEHSYIRNKITRLGVDIAAQVGAEIKTKLNKHSLNILQVEDLRWVTGKKHGSRWNHAKQQESITHSLRRVGIHTRKVNPKNTSQVCHKCATPIVHNSKNRTVWCMECKTKLDRDFNAAMSIANKTFHPVSKRENGDNCSPKPGQVVEHYVHEQLIKQEKQLN